MAKESHFLREQNALRWLSSQFCYPVHSKMVSFNFLILYLSFHTIQHKILSWVSEFLITLERQAVPADESNRYYSTTTRETTLFHGNRKRKITPKTNMYQLCFVKPMWSLQYNGGVVCAAYVRLSVATQCDE